MVIEREEMQEIVKTYQEPVGLNLGSHSALDAWQGQRDYGIRSIIYVTPQRARIYLQNPMVGRPDEAVEDLPRLIDRKGLTLCNNLSFTNSVDDYTQAYNKCSKQYNIQIELCYHQRTRSQA